MKAAWRVQVFRGRGKQPWFWRLRARNGRVLATSEGYARKRSAINVAARLCVALGIQATGTGHPPR